MKLVGIAVKELVIASELTTYVGTRFYNSLAPQKCEYPLIVGRVIGVEPVDFKASPGSGKACTDTLHYRIMVCALDSETAATIASKVRKIVDRPRPGPYKGIQINTSKFLTAYETTFKEDDADVFAWELDFEIRVDFSTDDN